MIWLALLKRFWPLIPVIGSIVALLVMGARLDHASMERDEWREKAERAIQSVAEWQASFKASEAARMKDNAQSVNAINASEGLCDQRVAKARSSAVKIERIVTKPAECKPGEAIPRSLVDPAVLADSLR